MTEVVPPSELHLDEDFEKLQNKEKAAAAFAAVSKKKWNKILQSVQTKHMTKMPIHYQKGNCPIREDSPSKKGTMLTSCTRGKTILAEHSNRWPKLFIQDIIVQQNLHIQSFLSHFWQILSVDNVLSVLNKNLKKI